MSGAWLPISTGEMFFAPKTFQHLDEFVHASVAGVGRGDPSAVAEQLEFLLKPAIDHIDGEPAAGDPVERRAHLGRELRRYHSGIHRGHDLYGPGAGGERRRQHPGFEVGAKQPLGDERDIEAVGLALRHHIQCELERLVRAGVAARADLANAHLDRPLRLDCVRQRRPNPQAHRFPSLRASGRSGARRLWRA